MKVTNYYVLNVNECKDENGNVKRWQFDVAIPNDYYCHFYLNSFNLSSSPSFYAEDRHAYKMDTGEPVDNNYYKGESKSNICMVIALYIKENIPEMKEWAERYIDNYNCIRNAIEQSGFKKEQTILLPSKKEVSFTLCSQMVDKIKSFNDIEFYLSYDDVFSGGDDLVKLACDATNMEAIEKSIEKSKEDLISFYLEHDIADLLETPYDLLTEDERSDMGFFSDWYKDIYHYRPRSLDNEVQHYLDSQKDQEEYNYEK